MGAPRDRACSRDFAMLFDAVPGEVVTCKKIESKRISAGTEGKPQKNRSKTQSLRELRANPNQGCDIAVIDMVETRDPNPKSDQWCAY
jgi:hypothetical protein